jgi:UDP-GlcNAc:undecaprenyl-phosphate/decaprenyl-phosphate GlcNAc-1-phosphate transferase
MNIYLSVYIGSLVLVLLMTPAVIWLSRRFGFVHAPGVRHIHTRPMSHVGGVAIFLAMMSTSVAALYFSNVTGAGRSAMRPQLPILLLAACFVFLTGLVDDIKSTGLQARVKFIAQIAAAVILCAAGIRIQSVVVADSVRLDFGWASWPLTLLWIVGVTNAVNLIDGLDGLAAGISAIACGVMAVLGVLQGQVAVVVLMLALLGSLCGFLFFNFNPARIFMGDCGSMFLGFTLASSAVLCSMRSVGPAGLALPALALGVPIFDTLFSMLRRFLERRSIFSADRSHLHHRLIDAGFTQRQAVLAIYGLTLLAAGTGMLMLIVPAGHALILLFAALFLLLVLLRSLGFIRLKDIRTALQKRYACVHQEHEDIKRFEDATLYFRRATTLDQWWLAVSTAANKMDFLTVELPLVNRDGTARALTWRHNGDSLHFGREGLIQVHLPIRDRRSGSSLSLRIEVRRNGSLEAAGRRVALFTRLIEEHDIVNLSASRRDVRYAEGTRQTLYS